MFRKRKKYYEALEKMYEHDKKMNEYYSKANHCNSNDIGINTQKLKKYIEKEYNINVNNDMKIYAEGYSAPYFEIKYNNKTYKTEGIYDWSFENLKNIINKTLLN